MRYFFTPAIAVMNRLGYTGKFLLLWLMSLVAIAVVVSSLYASLDKEISSSRQELEGVALATPISRAVQIVQQHRGLSAALLDGNTTMGDMRTFKQREVDDTLAELERRLPATLCASADWRSIKTNWTDLGEAGLDWTMAQNFAAHTHLIQQLLLFKVVVSGEYVLPLDPQLDTSYLIDAALNRLPLALEHLGQIRAHGVVILTEKRATEAQKIKINTLIAQLDEEIRVLRANLDKVGGYNPALKTELTTVSLNTAGLAQQVVDLVSTEIIAGRYAVSPEDFFRMTTEAIDHGYGQMYESLLPTIETLIRARIASAENALRASIGIAFLLFLAAVYLSIGIYYGTTGSIQSLALCARSFAGGDMNRRIDLGVCDELKQVGDSFNEMADGFSGLLAARQEDEARLRSILETAMDAMVQMDTEGIITGWNDQAVNMFGWSREQAIGRVLHQTIIPARFRDAHVHGTQAFLASGEGAALNTRLETIGLHRDGHEFPVELSITAIRTAGKYEFNGFIRDISQKKESEELIWKQANYDTVTGLPNRRMFYDRLEQGIKKAKRAGSIMALLFIDLDRFKEVNDTLGHTTGDILLMEAAFRIGECARDSDTVARLGGDEFIVLLSELDNTNSIERIAEKILLKLAEPFELGGKVAYISASIGITLYPNDGDNIEYLLQNADQAMYVSKNMGRNRYSYFTPELQEAARNRRQLINDLHGALAAEQFMVYYQPIVNLDTGRIDKLEALIRWQHPERGLVSPATFIPLAEETGLIVKIGDWVFKEAARQAKRWRAQYNPALQISVNMSPVQFRNDNSPSKTWPLFLQELGLPGQSMVIEITEGLLLDANSDITGELLEFHAAGINISLDDFGTGYSSLSYLKKFDIDYLKIDQSFTRNLAFGSSDMALSEAIIVMAHKLGLTVIAEGVETEDQRSLLAIAGCDYAQGYLYSRPVPAREFEKLLEGNLARA